MAGFSWFKNKNRGILRSLKFVDGGRDDAVELYYGAPLKRASHQVDRQPRQGLGLRRINCLSRQVPKKTSESNRGEKQINLPFTRSLSSGGVRRSKKAMKGFSENSSQCSDSTSKHNLRLVQDVRISRPKRQNHQKKEGNKNVTDKVMKNEKTVSNAKNDTPASFTHGKIRFQESTSGDLPPARPSELKVHFLEPTLSDLTRVTLHSSNSYTSSAYDNIETESTWADTEYAFSEAETIQTEDEMDFFFKCF